MNEYIIMHNARGKNGISKYRCSFDYEAVLLSKFWPNTELNFDFNSHIESLTLNNIISYLVKVK